MAAFLISMVAPPSTAALFVSRKRIFMHEPPSPWFLFVIYQLMLVRIQTHIFEMLEVIFFVADPMVHKPLLPTNELLCAAVAGGATKHVHYSLISPKMMKNSYISAYP